MTRNQAHLLLILVTILWGLTFVAQKTGMETLGPMSFTSARYLIGSIAILPIALIELRQLSIIPVLRTDMSLLAKASAMGCFMFCGISLQQTSLQYTNIANAAFLTALYVPAVPFLTWLLYKYKIKIKIWFALLISITGSWMLSGSGTIVSQFGDFLALASVLFWASHIILISNVAKEINMPFQLSFIQSVICFFLSLIFSLTFEKPVLSDFLPAAPEIIMAGLLGTLGFSFQIVGQRYSDPTASAFILSLESIVGAIAGWLILSQILGFSAIFGCFLIFLAVIIADVIPDHWVTIKVNGSSSR